jgi:hypothetical protein
MSPIAAVAAIPIAAWEFSLGVYLTVKGFRPGALVAADRSWREHEAAGAGAATP